MSLKVKPLTGPYEPLLLDIPLRNLPHSLSKLVKRSELITLVIDKNALQASKRPFIVPYTP
jgi:hypothetical protein